MAEPPITLQAIHYSAGSNSPYDRVVIHCTAPGIGYPAASKQGDAHGTAQYFQQASSGGSAHDVFDIGGAATREHCVAFPVIAWHAPPNPRSIGKEVCGEPSYTRAQWLSDAVWPAVEACALSTREDCLAYSIPMVRITSGDLLRGAHGITGHVDVSQAWHQSTHWDPGPNFPWDRFMAVVLAGSPAAAAPPKQAMPPAQKLVIRQYPRAAWRPGPWSATELAAMFATPDGQPHRSLEVVQTALNGQGCGPLVADGVIGDHTKTAWRNWEWRIYGRDSADANDIPNRSTVESLGNASQLFIGGI